MKALIQQLKRVDSPGLRYFLLRARGSLHYAARGHLVRKRAVERYLASTPEPKLHLGAGPLQLPGWLNSDLLSAEIYVDAASRLPFGDSTFAYVFTEHLIEHLSERQGLRLLCEIRRVLRPGGIVRLTTPDLRKLIALYKDENGVIRRDDYAAFLGAMEGKRYESGCQLLNDLLRRWGHQFIYDEQDLVAKLCAAGFANVARVEPGESRHPALRGLERHGGEPWVNQAEAMTLEATVPA